MRQLHTYIHPPLLSWCLETRCDKSGLSLTVKLLANDLMDIQYNEYFSTIPLSYFSPLFLK